MAAVARTLLQRELEGCFLTLIGGGPEATQLLAQLAVDLHIAYQVSSYNLDARRPPNIMWTQSPCDAFLVVEGGAAGTLEYLQNDALPWNYRGRYVFFGDSCPRDLQHLAATRKMSKTEHVIFVCGGRGAGLEVWTHWLYSPRPWRLIGYASHNGLTRLSPFFPPKLADLQGFPLVVKTFAFAPSVFGTVAKEETEGPKGEKGKSQQEEEEKAEEGGGKGREGGRVFLPVGGQDVSFILLLAKHLNFTVQWRHPGPELWGTLQDDGTYTGVVGQVGSGDGELGVANIFLDILRTRYATFTYPYTYEIACFITPAPQELPPWISLGSPFSVEVWAALVATLLGASLLGPLLARILDLPKDMPMFYSWGRWFAYTVGTFTCQSQKVPLTDRLRLASISLQLMGFVAAISFSGNLTAFLTTRNVEAAVRSLSQLDGSGLAVVGFSNYWLNFFLASQNTHLLSLARKYRAVADTLPVFR
ncbi:uncharacterized protein LOC127006695 [Eriocheir sinensis]|uniref:uncharacterized protein LOC127006695 n=1 Tax=Eriocheir sinensis TaxID=95602 RepID=UPI0021CAD9F0|nr:uncharacterized protein LOC127006695 [Eriocheir sinensis]